MSLRGSLGDFGIGDIFQLIVAQRKTGDLIVEGSGTGRVRIAFEAGRIVDVGAQRPKRQSLGQRLVRGGLLSSVELKRALKEQKRSKQPLGQILKAHKTVAGSHIDALLDLQLRETLLGVFDLTEGEYHFDAKPYKGASGKPTVVDANSILMDAIQRVEEWPVVRARINNFDTIFRLTGKGPSPQTVEPESNDSDDDGFGDWGSLDESGNDAPDLGKQRLRDLVDGKLRVRALVDRSCLGEFETCKALISLWDDGEIEPIQIMRAVENPRGQRRVSVRRLALMLSVNILIVGSVVGLYTMLPRSQSQIAVDSQRAAYQSLERLRANRLAVISAALEVHRVRHGVYPVRLDALVEGRVLDSAMLSPADGLPLDYVSIGNDYVLR